MTELAKPSKTSTPGVDLPRIRAMVEPIARAQGAELVDVEWTTEGRGFVLRISIDKAGSAEKKSSTEDSAVDLEVCSNISRAVSQAFDENDPFPSAMHYALEVGSPGVERALRSPADYDRFAGKKAKLRLIAPVDGQKVLVGVLSGVQEALLTFLVEAAPEAKPYVFPLTQIASARLVFELGTTPKAGPKAGPKPGPKPGPNPGPKSRPKPGKTNRK